MADGSQGCSVNWADFPVAAIISPIWGMVMSKSFERMKIC